MLGVWPAEFLSRSPEERAFLLAAYNVHGQREAGTWRDANIGGI